MTSAEPQQPILSLQNISAGYGDTTILEHINLDVASGEAISIIGRNGVGKTTLLRTIMGETRLKSGRLRYKHNDISADETHQRVWAGIAYVPQEREIFPSLNVSENIAVAERPGDINRDHVFELFPQLKERLDNMGNQLSGGEQQMLAIGRALVANPKLLLMDEPSEGLAPVIVEQLEAAIGRLRDDFSMSIVLVEQNSRVALQFAQRCVVLNRGQIERDGSSLELQNNPELLERLVGLSTGAS